MSIEEATERDKALIRSSLTDLGMRLKSISRENSLARIGIIIINGFFPKFFSDFSPLFIRFLGSTRENSVISQPNTHMNNNSTRENSVISQPPHDLEPLPVPPGGGGGMAQPADDDSALLETAQIEPIAPPRRSRTRSRTASIASVIEVSGKLTGAPSTHSPPALINNNNRNLSDDEAKKVLLPPALHASCDPKSTLQLQQQQQSMLRSSNTTTSTGFAACTTTTKNTPKNTLPTASLGQLEAVTSMTQNQSQTTDNDGPLCTSSPKSSTSTVAISQFRKQPEHLQLAPSTLLDVTLEGKTV